MRRQQQYIGIINMTKHCDAKGKHSNDNIVSVAISNQQSSGGNGEAQIALQHYKA
jgi:hypothetical protein